MSTEQRAIPLAIPFELTPALLLRALRKNWLLVVIASALSLTGAYFFTARQTRIYEAVATVQFDPQPLLPLGNQIQGAWDSGPESFWNNQEYFATQHQIITSRRVAMLVVKRLGLNRDGAFLSMTPPGSNAPSLEAPVEAAADALRSRVAVKAIEDSRLATVKYTDTDPERARRVLAALIDTYVDQNLDSSLDSSNKTAEWLDTQLAKLKTELEAQEMDLHDFKRHYNLLSVSYDDQSNMLRAEIQQLNASLTTLKTRRETVAARLSVLSQVDPKDPAEIPQSENLIGTRLSELRLAYLAAKTARIRLLEDGKGEKHPAVVAAETEVEAARTNLLGELKNIKAGAADDLASVTRELQGLTTLYEAAKKEALELNLNELRYTRLKRSKDSTEKLFGLVLERSTESGVSKAMPFNNVRVLDHPLKPEAPIAPNPRSNLAFGGALGLMLGLVGAIGRELLDRRIRGAEDAEADLGLPVLGSLPDVANNGGRTSYAYYGRKSRKPKPDESSGVTEPELVVHTHPKSAVAEAARSIRTNLLFMSPDVPYRTLLVTSAGPSEGKTTVAACLAIAMAQAGQRVCLVDCDLRRPRIHHLFEGDRKEGLTTALLARDALDSAIHHTPIENLMVLPSGPVPPNPADLMHSEAFARLLEELKTRFDRVVIDSPPVGLVTDGVILSTRADAVVLVVRALKTSRDAARRALRTLRDVGANCPGFILNASTPQSGYDYRGYYGTYGAGAETPSADS